MRIRPRGRLLRPLCAALATAAAGVASATSVRVIEGVAFDEALREGDTRLELAGLGLMRWRVLFRGYVAALYLPPHVAPAEALADVPKRLEIEYFWPIDGDAIARAGEALLRRNVPAETLATLAPRLRTLERRYESVAPGDRYALTYLPGRGTTLAKNGRPLAQVEGADFAVAYFSIWLGEDPIDTSLRDQLLGGS